MQGKGAGYTIKGAIGIGLVEVFWLALVIGIGSVFLMRFILNSKLGLGLAAIRDNEKTAGSSGIDVFKLKLFSFVISAFVTGIAGAVFFMYQGHIEPRVAFDIKWTIIAMLATIIGGMSTRDGPVLGALVVVFMYFLLARFGEISLLIQGMILVLIMLLAPQGIMGSMRKIKERFPLQRRTTL